jgi:hypothetical protein
MPFYGHFDAWPQCQNRAKVSGKALRDRGELPEKQRYFALFEDCLYYAGFRSINVQTVGKFFANGINKLEEIFAVGGLTRKTGPGKQPLQPRQPLRHVSKANPSTR